MLILEKINLTMGNSLKFDKEYFDGTRDQGYGGYSYDGRWVKVAKKINKLYDLNKKLGYLM